MQNLIDILGACVDLQYCLTASDEETTLRVHRLAARVIGNNVQKVISKTQTKKKTRGIGQFYKLTSNSRYCDVVITIFNTKLTRGWICYHLRTFFHF